MAGSSNGSSNTSSSGSSSEDEHQKPIASEAQPSQPRPEFLDEAEDTNARQMVYLVTLSGLLASRVENSAAEHVDLQEPGSFSREEIRDAFMWAVEHPVNGTQRGGRPRKIQLKIQKIVVFRELHADGRVHYHVAIKLNVAACFLPLKLALLGKYRLASHWSSSHRLLWSAVRYGYFTTPRKPVIDTAPKGWSGSGEELNLYKESQEPFNADVIQARRQKREREEHAPEQTASKGKQLKKAPVFSKLDFISMVIAERLTTPAAVLAYAQKHGGAAVQGFVAKSHRRLQEYLDDAAEWTDAADTARKERQTDWELVAELSTKTCKCDNGLCRWWEAADDFFIRNEATLCRKELAATLANVIRHGPTKTSRVPLIVGATNSAKSTILKPIVNVFGFGKIVHRPSEKASMALANITKRGKRFTFLDEYRQVEFAARGNVPVGTFLSLFGGASLEIQVSQSFQNGNAEILWRRGAAMTANEEGLWDPVPPLPGLVQVTKEDIRHMQTRVFQFRASVPVPEVVLAPVPECAESFCRWLVVESASYASAHVHRPLQQLVGRALPVLSRMPPETQQAAADQEESEPDSASQSEHECDFVCEYF